MLIFTFHHGTITCLSEMIARFHLFSRLMWSRIYRCRHCYRNFNRSIRILLCWRLCLLRRMEIRACSVGEVIAFIAVSALSWLSLLTRLIRWLKHSLPSYSWVAHRWSRHPCHSLTTWLWFRIVCAWWMKECASFFETSTWF